MGPLPGARSSRHLGREVHHVAVALHRLELVDLLGPEAHHPSHVVAGQVHQHDVLGHLLGVLGRARRPGGRPRLRSALAAVSRRWAATPPRRRAAEPAAREWRPPRCSARCAGSRGTGSGSRAAARGRSRRGRHRGRGRSVATARPGRCPRPGCAPWRSSTAPWNVLRRHGGRAPRGPRRRAGAPRAAVRPTAGTGRPASSSRRAPAASKAAAASASLHASPTTTLSTEHDALAPVVEGAQLADDVEDGVGKAEVVTGDVGQMLHLSHDVVAQVPDEPAVQRWQVGDSSGER